MKTTDPKKLREKRCEALNVAYATVKKARERRELSVVALVELGEEETTPLQDAQAFTAREYAKEVNKLTLAHLGAEDRIDIVKRANSLLEEHECRETQLASERQQREQDRQKARAEAGTARQQLEQAEAALTLASQRLLKSFPVLDVPKEVV